MDRQLKAKWIEALRSGKYEQCTDQLKSNVGFCCLGVALDIQGYEWKGGDAFTPGRIVRSLDTPTPEAMGGLSMDDANKLIGMNDKHKKSFAEIADYIESHL